MVNVRAFKEPNMARDTGRPPTMQTVSALGTGLRTHGQELGTRRASFSGTMLSGWIHDGVDWPLSQSVQFIFKEIG
jgi:hypothetical protein